MPQRRLSQAQLDSLERKRSLEHIKDPDRWHHLGRCPLKKRNPDRPTEFPKVGYLIEGGGPTVYLGNMFTPSMDHASVTFDSFEAIIDDGWVVD